MAIRGKTSKKHARKAVSPQQRALNEQTMRMAVQFHGASNLARAQDLYRQVLDTDPRNPDALHHLGLCAYQQGALDKALDLIKRSVAIKSTNPDALYNLAKVYFDLGHAKEAIVHYQKALKLRPDAETHFNLANIFQTLHDWRQAADHYRAAVDIAPSYAEAHTSLGAMLEEMGEVDGALESFQNALASNPHMAQAHYGRAGVLDKSGRVEALGQAAADAIRACPDSPLCIIAEALYLRRTKDFDTARQRLESIDAGDLSPSLRTHYHYLLGGICERLDDPPTAFTHFTVANGLARARLDEEGVDPVRFQNVARNHASCFTPEWIRQWQPAPPEDGRADPVFMVGFPRSGTTLLDTILRGHPEITVVEEADAMAKAYGALKLSGRNALATLKRAQRVKAFRKAYFAVMDHHPDGANASEGAVMIDKLPLHTVFAGVLKRAFPNAKFILVQRHPCDCVLSCFMQNFGHTDAMANFLDLEDAAQLYDMTFTLWRHYTDLLDLNVHTIRYEDLIGDMEGQVRPLLDFLGLEWHDGVCDYTQTARSRKRINTPSYNQVTEKLYTRASGRWQNYRTEMAPVLDILAPWAERFGYDM